MTWLVERFPEDAATFHARALPEPLERAVWVAEPTAPALVLGSAQRDDVVDRAACAAAGVEVVRRRSGGGAVLVVPGGQLWLDVLLPADDPLWQDDVGRAFLWLGDVWQAALGAAFRVHRDGLVTTPSSSLVCFAGLGAGEVVDAAGRKVVGISQRRTRAGARFQCAALLRWDPGALAALLAVPIGDLTGVAAGVALEPDALLTSFLAALPT